MVAYFGGFSDEEDFGTLKTPHGFLGLLLL